MIVRRWILALAAPAAVFFCLALTPADAEACFHVASKVEVGQFEQQAVIFHRDGQQDLVVRIGLEASGPVESLGWVLPVPSLPDSYGVYDGEIFEELDEAVDLRERRQRGLTVGTSSPAESMRVQEHPSASAGPFRIQPIEVDPDRGVAPLQEWLTVNDFETLDASQLQYYVRRGWVFLAIRVDPQEGQAHLEQGGRLPALRASFASEHAVYPLKMSTHQGVFPVRFYLITDEPPQKEDFMGAALRGFHVAAVRDNAERWGLVSIDILTDRRLSATPLTYELSVGLGELNREKAPAAVARFLEDAGAWDRRQQYALSVLYNPHVNEKAGVAAEWPEELAIPALPVRAVEPSQDTSDATQDDPPAADRSGADQSTGCFAGGSPADRPGQPLGLFVGVLLVVWRVGRRGRYMTP